MGLNRKNKLLVAGFVVMLFLSYKFAISNTLDSYQTFRLKSEEFKTKKLSKATLQKLHAKERQLDALTASYNITNPVTFQNDLLKQLSQYSKMHRLKIIDFSEPHVTEKNGLIVTNYKFTLEGSFNDFLLLLNQIENKPELGAVKHLHFVKKMNFKTNREHVFFEVILERSV